MTVRCSACSTPIGAYTKSGMCRTCCNRSRALPQLHCSDCSAPITASSRTGKCFLCYHGQKRASGLPSVTPRIWCGQCERNVLAAEGARCTSKWCGAKAVA